MPGKKKAVKKKPAAKPAPPTLKEVVATYGVRFPCEASQGKAEELYEVYGEKLLPSLEKRQGEVLPLSLLLKVIAKECAGVPVVLKASASIKDKG